MNPRNHNVYLISFRTLRQLIGVLGILLPLMCWFVNVFVNHLNLLNNPLFVNVEFSKPYVAGIDLKPSISDFYYTTAGPTFTGILLTVAIFLFTYNGYPLNRKDDRYAWLSDKRICNFAAVCAIGIIVFPTSSAKPITDNIHIFVSSHLAGVIHLVFAALFFLSMAVMSIVNFRRHPNKVLIRDAEGKLYLICGWGIILCVLILAIFSLIPHSEDWLWGKSVYIMEVFMLLFFGVAWLVKGKSIPTEFILNKLEE